MKKVLMLLPILGLLISLTACGSDSISFSQGIGLQPGEVASISLRNGNTGDVFDITDYDVIEGLFNDLADCRFVRDKEQKAREGWAYYIDVYPKDGEGYVRYATTTGFTKFSGFSHDMIEGVYFPEDGQVQAVLEKLYQSLSKKA